jgi:hypothetical protein
LPFNRAINDAARDRLKELVRSERAVALTGAGVSAWAGYPLWRPLITRLVDYACLHHPDPVEQDGIRAIAIDSGDDLVAVAKKLSGFLMPRHFKAFLTQNLGTENFRQHPIISQLCALPFRDLFSLNLDPSLEYAHSAVVPKYRTYSGIDTGAVAQFLKSADEKLHVRNLIYLHGRFSDALDGIAFTTDGYESVYRESFEILMTVIAATRRVVFLGFGFEDERLLAAFSRTASALADATLCHFAVKPFENIEDEAAVRKQYRDTWNVEIVFYDLTPEDDRGAHAGFLDLIADIAVSVDRRYVPAEALAQPAITAPPANAEQHLDRINAANLGAIREDEDV